MSIGRKIKYRTTAVRSRATGRLGGPARPGRSHGRIHTGRSRTGRIHTSRRIRPGRPGLAARLAARANGTARSSRSGHSTRTGRATRSTRTTRTGRPAGFARPRPTARGGTGARGGSGAVRSLKQYGKRARNAFRR